MAGRRGAGRPREILGFDDQVEVVRARAERSDDPDIRDLGLNWAT
jgi:hypothetical protein